MKRIAWFGLAAWLSVFACTGCTSSTAKMAGEDCDPLTETGCCCSTHAECRGNALGDTPRCYASTNGGPGVCTRRPVLGCYANFDCLAGQTCEGATLACGVAALTAGRCTPERGAECSFERPTGCCFADGDCATGERCYPGVCREGGAGVCLPAPADLGSCWSAIDCPGGVCENAVVCGCGMTCPAPNAPGECAYGA